MRRFAASRVSPGPILNALVLGVAALLATACSSMSDVLPDRRVDYKSQQVAEDSLELPPDLSGGALGDTMPVPDIPTGDAATYSAYSQERRVTGVGTGTAVAATGVLPEMGNVVVAKDGNQRWLEINAKADLVWPRVVSFWRENGILLVEQDPAIGVMKTDWLENRADIKQGAITELFRKALDGLYSAATRDQFRVRLEPGDAPGTTNLYLTHRGMEEKLRTTTGGDTENTFWVPRPNDPELEAEMLRRIMVYLGVADKRAERAVAQAEVKGQPRSELIKGRDGAASLLVYGDMAQSWRMVGVALERVGFAVEDRDRTAGVYYVRYDDPMRKGEEKGFFSKLAFWKDDEKIDRNMQYRIRLQEQAGATRVLVQNDKGQPEQSETGERILTLVHEQLR